jgi:lysophospholipase L1-like esterase
MASPRRQFIKQGLLAGIAANISSLQSEGPVINESSPAPGSTILFQGDSITDGGRWKGNDWNHIMGQGYAFIVAGKIGYKYPSQKYLFVNRGVSGNKVSDLGIRWEEDTIAIKPDMLSILIGVNDTTAEVGGNKSFSAESYADGYRGLLQNTKEKLPETKFVIGEPFLLPVGRVKDKWSQHLDAIIPRQNIARELAREFNAAFVPYQELFTAAAKKSGEDTWLWDGVHPMPAGHELMAEAWIKAVNKKFKFF